MWRIYLLLFVLIPSVSFAHAPVREVMNDGVVHLNDPTEQSIAAYGEIGEPGEVDVYSFTTSEEAIIPVEVLVPIQRSNKHFYPSVVVAHPDLPSFTSDVVELPEGYGAVEFSSSIGEREVFYEPFSQERLYRGNEQVIEIEPGHDYMLYVYDPRQQVGDYSLGIGTVENFQDQNIASITKDVFFIKFGITGGQPPMWYEIVSLFVLLAGFVIGLGAVTVIEIHGFLGRKSGYWTQATTRAHKVTKPLIWAGIGLVIVGTGFFYGPLGWTGLLPLMILIIVILVLNGLFLTFVVSPYLLKQEKQKKDTKLLPKRLQVQTTISFFISIIGWWSLLFLNVWYLIELF